MRGRYWHVRTCRRIRQPRMSQILTREERRMGSSHGTSCAREQPRRVLKLCSRKQLPSNFRRISSVPSSTSRSGSGVTRRRLKKKLIAVVQRINSLLLNQMLITYTHARANQNHAPRFPSSNAPNTCQQITNKAKKASKKKKEKNGSKS